MALNTLGPDAEKQGGESFRWAGKLHCVKSRAWKYIKYALLSVVIVIGALLLFLPTILYHLPILSRDGADGNRSNMSSVPTFESGYSNIQPLNCSTLKCQEAFSCSVVGNTSLCLPVCGSWSQYSNGSALAIKVAIITSSAVNFILSVVVLVISCIRWKNMLSFPSVFVVYMTITLMMQDVVLLIAHAHITSLFCASEYYSVIEGGETQIVGPTPFCTLSGFWTYYFIFQMSVWGFCHIVSLFWGIQFPFHAKSFKTAHRLKYIHIPMVIVGLVLPTLPGIVASTAGDPTVRGFRITTFPPNYLCGSLQKDIIIYSLVLPINLILVTEISLLIIIFWVIHKHHGLFKRKSSNQSSMIGTAERKILIVICYCIMLVMVVMTGYIIVSRNEEVVMAAIKEYWQCEAIGIDPDRPCIEMRASFEELTYPGLNILAYLIFGLSPAINLIFVVNIKELKKKLKISGGQAANETPNRTRIASATSTVNQE